MSRHKKDDQAIISKLLDLAERYPTKGFETYYGKIRLDGLLFGTEKECFGFTEILI